MIGHHTRPEPRHTAEAIAAQQPGSPPSPPEPPGHPFAPRADTTLITGQKLARTTPAAMLRPRFIPNPPPETCTTCGCDLDAGSCGWCQPRQATPSHAATRLAAVVFWHDRRDLPVFRQTVRARGWCGQHLRAAGVVDSWAKASQSTPRAHRRSSARSRCSAPASHCPRMPAGWAPAPAPMVAWSGTCTRSGLARHD